jgi:hypothetical protein
LLNDTVSLFKQRFETRFTAEEKRKLCRKWSKTRSINQTNYLANSWLLPKKGSQNSRHVARKAIEAEQRLACLLRCGNQELAQCQFDRRRAALFFAEKGGHGFIGTAVVPCAAFVPSFGSFGLSFCL